MIPKFRAWFPAPLEVDRYLYIKTRNMVFVLKFPAPLEVDRYLYGYTHTLTEFGTSKFPAPLEVDRYLYPISCI